MYKPFGYGLPPTTAMWASMLPAATDAPAAPMAAAGSPCAAGPAACGWAACKPHMQQRFQHRVFSPHAPFASLSSSHMPHMPHFHLHKLSNFSGTWLKDKARSSSMEEALDLMHVNGIIRQAIKLVRGVEIKQDDITFTMAVFSVFAWFKVREAYALSGEPSECKRRDLRRGKHVGKVQQHGRELRLQLSWGDPFGGTGVDEFKLVSEDELHIRSDVQVAGQKAHFTTVYRRKGTKTARQDRQQKDQQHHHEPAGQSSKK